MVPIGTSYQEEWLPYHIRLSKELKKKLRKRAKELNISMADLIRDLIKKEVN